MCNCVSAIQITDKEMRWLRGRKEPEEEGSIIMWRYVRSTSYPNLPNQWAIGSDNISLASRVCCVFVMCTEARTSATSRSFRWMKRFERGRGRFKNKLHLFFYLNKTLITLLCVIWSLWEVNIEAAIYYAFHIFLRFINLRLGICILIENLFTLPNTNYSELINEDLL